MAACVSCVPDTLCSLSQCGNLMFVEVIPKDPLSFSVFDYKNPKLQHTVQVTDGLLTPKAPNGRDVLDLPAISMLPHVLLFKSPLVGQIPARQMPLDSAPEETDSGEPPGKDPS